MERKATIKMAMDLDARTTALFVQTAGRFSSRIYMQTKECSVNAKSIMGMMSLGIGRNQEVTLVIEGQDEEEALKALTEFLSSGQ